MQAAVLHEHGKPLDVTEVLLDAPGPGEVRVRLAAAGVCHSDLHIAEGRLGAGRAPIVLGHEGAGVVEELGEGVTEVAVGDRVGFSFLPACGSCEQCRAGRYTFCGPGSDAAYRGTMMDGTRRLRLPGGSELQHGLLLAAFAERNVVPASVCVRMPNDLPLWQAALVGCAVVTGFGAVRNVARVRLGDRVCVIGCGGVGLQVIAAARLSGAGVVVAVDREEAKLERALRQGATHGIVASGDDTHRRVMKAAGGGVDHAIEVVGRPETIRLAWDVLRPGATAVVVGLAGHGVEASVPAIEFLSDKGLKGCFYGSGRPTVDIAQLAGLAAQGRIDLAGTVSHVTTLDGIEEAFERMRRGEGARTVAILDAGLAGRSAD